MIVVSNTTPLISLFRIGQIELLKILFEKVFIPIAVYKEIVVLGQGKHGSDILGALDYITVQDIQNKLAVGLLQSQLDYGEAEAIVLANELDADILILDEKKARKAAQANFQKIIGTVGILQIAKNKGIIPNMKICLDALISNNIWIEEKLYKRVLLENNEQ
ncbi:MAG: DUF3368 domain-containing protein [Sporomusaceae bacterium]|jgi:predicted nucleic acid-binding protein|nr:DUF3368 domain-containing protein [Sporomusaceae bacterium]